MVDEVYTIQASAFVYIGTGVILPCWSRFVNQ
jgi:hypothetical protein